MKYILIFFTGWIGSLIIGGIVGSILGSNRSNIGGFIAGLITPLIVVFFISLILIHKNQNDSLDLLPVFLAILPIALFNLRGLYLSGIQDASNNYNVGETGLTMKINKFLIYGTLIGCTIALYLFTQTDLI